jgi:hypothetical protein
MMTASQIDKVYLLANQIAENFMTHLAGRRFSCNIVELVILSYQRLTPSWDTGN